MALVNGNSEFNTQVFAKNTSITKGTDIFTLGGDYFSIKTNMDDRVVRDLSLYVDNFSDPVTLDDIVLTTSVGLTIDDINIVTLNFDKTELTNFSYFGSLRDKMQFSIINIVNAFPASIFINNINNVVLLTILNYTYDLGSNRAAFKVPVAAISNYYNLIIADAPNPLQTAVNLRNLPQSFSQYSLWNFVDEFPLVSFTGTTLNNNYIYFEVLGNPFPDITTGSGLKNFHIKPNYNNYEYFISNLDDFQGYLLNRESNPKYNAIFKVPNYDREGNTLLVDESFVWKTTDGYNLDYDTFEFQSYSEKLINLAQNLDDYKTNIISRALTSTSVKEFDTEDQRFDTLLKLYGKEFDEIKNYIDGLASMSRLSYDKKDNMPDILVKNFARTLGWGTFTSVTEDDLMKSFLGQSSQIILSGKTKNYTPIETDIELWRRIALNSAFLFKSKGTRNCIDFLFKIIGAPKSLIDFNEYIYVASNQVDPDSFVQTAEQQFPFDVTGYPLPLANTDDYYFQMKGGWISNKEIAPTNDKSYLSVIGIHTGPNDGGLSYFNKFTDFNGTQGFQIDRVADNVKSWSLTDTNHINLDKSTKYTALDHRSVLNSKEASIFLNPAKVVENDVYEYNKLYNFVINPTSLPYPYPDNELTRADVNTMSFLEYTDFIYSRFINAKNRKVIQTFGNGYPTLKKLYEDYYYATNPPSKQLDVNKVRKFVDQLGDFWLNLMEQFIPSTTIWQGGVLYRNTLFDRQKYDYKEGINDGSEFETVQPDNKEIPIIAAQASGTVSLPYIFLIEDIAKADMSYTSDLNFPPDGGDPTNDENDNILRVKPSFSSDSLSFLEPCLTMDQVSKITTGTVEPVKHNLSNGPKLIDFFFNCNTDAFAEGVNFKYELHYYDKVAKVFSTAVYYSKTFSNLVATGGNLEITETILAALADGDYIVKPSFIYNIDLGVDHDNILEFFSRLAQLGLPNNTGFSYSNGILTYTSSSIISTGVYGIYDETTDYWFSIISLPNQPRNKTALDPSGSIDLTTAQLVNEQLPITSNNQTVFYINYLTSGDIIFNVNGSSLRKSDDAIFSNGGEFYTTPIPNSNITQVTVKADNQILTTDVISAIYIKTATDTTFGSVYVQIPSITSGTTVPSGALYNTTLDKFMYKLPFTINQDVLFDQMIVILNGETLVKYTDYYYLSTDPTYLVFAGILEVNDTLLIYYPQNQDTGYLGSKTFVATWDVTNDDSTGTYTVEVSQTNDFAAILVSTSTPYIPSTPPTVRTYSLIVGDFTVPYMKYYFRIKSEKNNINLLGELTVTTVYSDILYFLTDNRVLV